MYINLNLFKRRRKLVLTLTLVIVLWFVLQLSLPSSMRLADIRTLLTALGGGDVISILPIQEVDWNRNILAFNRYVTSQRSRVFDAIPVGGGDYRIDPGFIYAAESQSDYFVKVARNPDVMTYALHWSDAFTANGSQITWLPGGKSRDITWPRESYLPAINEKLCNKFLRQALQNVTYHYLSIRTCTNRSSPSRSLLPLSHPDVGEFRDEYNRMLRHWERVHLHVIPHARVSHLCGRVAHDNIVINPYTCFRDPTFANFDQIAEASWLTDGPVTHVDEVFVANHHPHIFHWIVEGLTRLALYLEFLRLNPQVKVMIPHIDQKKKLAFLEPLGIPPSRVVTGHVTARVTYLPQGARCRSTVSALGAAMLSDAYFNYINTTLSPDPTPRDTIIHHPQATLTLACPA